MIEIIDREKVIDCYAQKVGIRTVEVRGFEFLINGKPFYFKGSACTKTILYVARARRTSRWSTISSC